MDIESKFLAAKVSLVKRITNKCSITYDSLNDMQYDINISIFDFIKMTDTKICKMQRFLFFIGKSSLLLIFVKREEILYFKKTNFCHNVYGVTHCLNLKERFFVLKT